MQTSERIEELAKALCKAQSKIENAKKDVKNDFFKSRYADLASVWDACRGPLTDNGLSIVQGLSSLEDKVVCTTLLLHISGQFIKSEFSMLPKDASPQAAGSCATYLRRYSLMAMVSIAPEDDDGNAASGKSLTRPQQGTTGAQNDHQHTNQKTTNQAPVVDVPALAKTQDKVDSKPAAIIETFTATNPVHREAIERFLNKHKAIRFYDKLMVAMSGKEFRGQVILEEWAKINPEAPDKEPEGI